MPEPPSESSRPPLPADDAPWHVHFTTDVVQVNYETLSVEDIRQAQEQRIGEYRSQQRRQLRICIALFLLTFLSTFLVGASFYPLEYLFIQLLGMAGNGLQTNAPAGLLEARLLETSRNGLMYAGPLMLILFFHEMGHYLQSLRYRVPASLPYFIPMPFSILGTMGAVIFQGRSVATRRQMFDIAVSGPLAGLLVTLPVLWIGISGSNYAPTPVGGGFLEFGDPLIIQWLCEVIHGPMPQGYSMFLNNVAFAGWVGVLITALNLLPVGQLDGGHIAYTLLRNRAHILSYGAVAAALGLILLEQNYSFVLLIVLVLLTGVRHPPTADDTESLGWFRHVLGWLTLSFLIIGFTPNPISI